MLTILAGIYGKVGCITEDESEVCTCNEDLCNGGTKREAGGTYFAIVSVAAGAILGPNDY